ncbi:MAG: host attachment protein [Gammaproteobacteria bacterium]|nr:host attachment protein [Gammaproteobacteria bacterium]NIR99263.1 host attachment protein [Gammaproteobacteria bacterium]NIT64884.1 host attachment protein [Gammaproteobacteria bacterium]NIV21834.1 host attachment protein [Gammaproteobacteria bacterium]NIX10903.1 host attachment protein [Gammaproteobacteria bacterium]
MSQYCVVVTNGSRARFFTLEPPQYPELESGPNLVERQQLVNPARATDDRELWSDRKTGRNRAANGGPAHGYDDHRSQHTDEFERRFANTIAEECSKLTRASRASDVVLVSQKRMLGFLRSAVQMKLNGVHTVELAKDLSKLSPHEVHAHLSRERLLPRRKSPAA